MTGQLKFRAWDEEEKIMITSDRSIATIISKQICGNLDLHSAGTNEKSKPKYIIMQFTGLLDCESKEIYAGDIVKFGYYESATETHVIVFENGQFHYTTRGFYHLKHIIDDSDFFKVIGNIYQNPELLENK